MLGEEEAERAELLAGYSCPASVYPPSVSVFEFPFTAADNGECRTAVEETLAIYNGRYSDFIAAEASQCSNV